MNSIIIAVFSSVICVLVIPRIINYARFSVYDSFDAAKKAANFQSFFMIGWTILVMGLFLVFYHRKYSK